MACFRKCPDNKLAYIPYSILQIDTNGVEYIQTYLFCSRDCLEFFRANYTRQYENTYEYLTEIVDNTREVCPLLMADIVNDYKQFHDKFKKNKFYLS
jgi:hypothetical protein